MAGLSDHAGVRLGRLTPGDVPAAARLSAGVGWNQDEADWARLLAVNPEGGFAAWLGDELVGTATLVRHGDLLAWLGMVIVREDVRGRGVAGRLVEAALAGLSPPPGGAVGLDATELGAPVYLRRGFEAVAPIDRWVGVLRTLSGASPSVRQAGPGDQEALARLDAAATGVDRRRLLERLLAEPGTAVLVAEAGGRAVAYAALRGGRERLHVGPVVAADEAACEAVLDAVAERAAGREAFVDAVRAPWRAQVLERRGLSVARSLQRMLRPALPALAMTGERVLAAAGFEWG